MKCKYFRLPLEIRFGDWLTKKVSSVPSRLCFWASLLFCVSCTRWVSPEKLDSLSLYFHDELVYDPTLTEKFRHEYLKDCSGVWDIATYAPPAFVFRNKHVTIYFFREAVVTIEHSTPSQFRRSTTDAERCIYDELVRNRFNRHKNTDSGDYGNVGNHL